MPRNIGSQKRVLVHSDKTQPPKSNLVTCMRKNLIVALVTLASSASVFGASGIFGTYVGINPDGSGNTWYGAQQPGPNTVTAFNNANLGTFDINTDSLTISGFQVLTYKNGSSDVTGANLYYRVYETGSTPGAFITQTANFLSNATFTDAAGNTFSSGGDQMWGQSAGSISLNVLNGISVTSSTEYRLELYWDATTNIDGTHFSNNGGSNYIASFTVIPEPSTYALLGLAAAGLGAHVFRRRRM